MAASASDYFQKVGESTATTLSSPGYTTGNTSINVASTTNWPTDTGVTFAIDEVDGDGARVSGTYNVFRGVVSSATQISSLTYVGGDANRDYSAGATTRVFIHVGEDQMNRMIDGSLVEHKQTGAHSDVTFDSLTANASATVDLSESPLATTDYGDATVTPEKLVSGTGSSWAWQSWTPTYTNFSLGNGTLNYAKYTQIGKTVKFRIKITLGSTSSVTGSWYISLPVSASTEYAQINQDAINANVFAYDSNVTTLYLGGLRLDISGTPDMMLGFTHNASTATATSNTINATSPMTWATSDTLSIAGEYEAA